MEECFKENFKCRYVFNPPPVHAKVYVWFSGSKPLKGFIGSANYTQTAFYKQQREAIVECSADNCFGYFRMITQDSVYCNHINADKLVQIHKRLALDRVLFQESKDSVFPNKNLYGLSHVKISFLDRNLNLPVRSGLNWGQRPEEGRDSDQGYIRLPSDIYRSNFFPVRGIYFTVSTDDNKVLICTRAQANGKAIHTPYNNSEIGQYFRKRLGLSQGREVTKENLLEYGRTDVDFYKIDEETYYMDFSKK
jgi:hypothetical protein